MRNVSIWFLLLSAVVFANPALAKPDLYDVDTIQKIEIFFAQENWEYMMDTAKAGSESYVMAKLVKINGYEYDSVGVKYKGNSSYSASRVKNPLTISLDEFKEQDYKSYSTLKLSNVYQDPSMIREVLAYGILSKYMYCSQANFAQVYINGASYGVYTNVENVNKQFCGDHFNAKDNTLIKCNPTTVAPALKSNLRYVSADSSKYQTRYEMKSDYGWNDLVALADSVTNYPSRIREVFNIDRVLWMLAFDNVIVNLDSYIGLYSQNYFVSRETSGKYNPIVWDLNMAFGGFINAGSGSTSDNLLTYQPQQAQMTPLLHAKDAYWPLVKAVMADSSLKRQYIAHMNTIIDENFANDTYVTVAGNLQSIIDTAVSADTTKEFTYEEFKNSLTDSVEGNYYIHGIKALMGARVSYLNSISVMTQVPPVISNIAASEKNDSVTFAALVTNGDTITLGIRTSTFDSFTKYPMYDDGNHNDGDAGDGFFAVTIPVTMKVAQYYMEAENDNAAIFAPARAEHEFYTFTSSIAIPVAGQVFINEFVAVNTTGVTSELGSYDDWIELYNTTSTQLCLNGLYLSDDTANLDKYEFPDNAVIPANGYLIIWADEHSSTPTGCHANFKLSAFGEYIVLSDGVSTILDSVQYGVLAEDVSLGRCPNATGTFYTMTNPTYSAENDCSSALSSNVNEAVPSVSVCPNPTDRTVSIRVSEPNSVVTIVDMVGREVFKASVSSGVDVETSSWADGIYTVICQDKAVKLIVRH